jgi:hypothetical protein
MKEPGLDNNDLATPLTLEDRRREVVMALGTALTVLESYLAEIMAFDSFEKNVATLVNAMANYQTALSSQLS